MREAVGHRDLQRIWLFSGCSQAELRRIRKALTEVSVPAGTLLVEEGTPGLLFFIVISGSASVRHGGRTVVTLGPGEQFGELSLLDREPRSASVVCDTDMVLLVLRQGPFQRVLRASPSITRKLLRTLAGRLRDSEDLVYG
jgi:CRP-like cAMP-binding protein